MDISLLLTSSQTHSSLKTSTESPTTPTTHHSLDSPIGSLVQSSKTQENSFQSTASTTVDVGAASKQISHVSNDHHQNSLPQLSPNNDSLNYGNSTDSSLPIHSLPSFSNLANPLLTQQNVQTTSHHQLESQKSLLQQQMHHREQSQHALPLMQQNTVHMSSVMNEISTNQLERRTTNKPFHCTFPDCNATFGQKGSLTRHIRSRHEKLRPHTCELCKKSFSALWTLRVHQRNVHLKSKPHKCHLCDKSFGELFNKSKHIAIVHEGKRPFSCPICSRAFGYKGDMRKHVLELHQQAGRPFQCIIPSCGVKFARKRYLRRHENLSHKGHPLLANRDRSSSPPLPPSTPPSMSMPTPTISNNVNTTKSSTSSLDATTNNYYSMNDQGASRIGVQELLFLGNGGAVTEGIMPKINGQNSENRRSYEHKQG